MKIIRHFLTLVFILALPISGAAQGMYEQHISSGLSNLEKKDYKAAEEAFRAALKESPDDYKATLYLGIVLNREGDKESQSYLKKALLMNPQDPQTNLQLGIYYYNRSVYPEAKDYFETAIELAPNSEYSVEASKYLQKMTKTAAEKPWRVDAAAGMQYDSNVILGPDNAPLPEGISRKADWSGVLYLKGQYDFLSSQVFKSTVSYSVYQSLHTKLSDFNISQHVAGLDTSFELSKQLMLRGAYAFEYVWVGSDRYDYAHTVGPSLTINEGMGFSSDVYYSYRWTRFINADLFQDNSDRTGSNNLVGITQHISVGKMVEARFGYAFDKDSTRKDFWAYDGNRGFAGLTVKPVQTLSVDLYGEYYDRDYSGISPLSGTVRHDIIHTYSLTLANKLSERCSLVLGQFYVRNKSNIDEFDYKRAITSIFITMRF